jgi:hypothetical protein
MDSIMETGKLALRMGAPTYLGVDLSAALGVHSTPGNCGFFVN